MKKNEIETVGSKPTGWLGSIAGTLMNGFHTSSYRKIIKDHVAIKFHDINKNTVLDIGCGGGISVKLFSQVNGISKVVGIDYSEEMVQLSKKVNKKYINNGKAEIQNANVLELPFDNDSFDMITAFDTINFWPDHRKAILEIIRVLKTNGTFFIINAYPKEGTKWHEFVKFKNDREYEKFLIDNGLKNIETAFEKNTIIVSGRK